VKNNKSIFEKRGIMNTALFSNKRMINNTFVKANASRFVRPAKEFNKLPKGTVKTEKDWKSFFSRFGEDIYDYAWEYGCFLNLFDDKHSSKKVADFPSSYFKNVEDGVVS
jgi:hypothetical protein